MPKNKGMFFSSSKEFSMKINISPLDPHSSSPAKILTHPNKIKLLAQRSDLYHGEDFYFGFDSSNHNFIDIIEQQEPLAIKYGQTLSLYHHTSNRTVYDLYFIEEKSRQLIPMIKLEAQAIDNGLVKYLIPFEFVDLYERVYNKNDIVLEDEEYSEPEQLISLFFKKLLLGDWPTEQESRHFQKAIHDLENDTTCRCQLENLQWIRTSRQKQKEPNENDFVAMNPFYDNARIELASLIKNNPECITVREIKDNNYPRIEIAVPIINMSEQYEIVFQKENPVLFQDLHHALEHGDTTNLSHLLKQHYPEKIQHYFSEIGIASSE